MSQKDTTTKIYDVPLGEAGMIDLMDKYKLAWTNHDVELLKSVFHPEGSYSDGVWNQTCSHHSFDSYFPDAFQESVEEFFETLETVFANSDKAVRIYRSMTKDENNNKIEITRGCEFFVFKNGLIFSVLDQYFPVLPSLVQEYAKQNVGFRSFPKYAKSGLREIEMGRLYTALLFLLEEEKIFLSHKLTASRLARRLECSVNHLSQVVNSRFGVNLNQLLNRHRILYACRILESTLEEDIEIESFAKECGFSSISGFYKIFKEISGFTPKAYHKRHHRILTED